MSATYVIAPNSPNATKNPVMTETLNVRFRKSVNGTMGCGVRRSMKKNPTRTTAATRSRPSTSGEKMSWSRVIDSATSSGTRPAARVNAPRKSMSRHDALWATFGIVSATAAIASAPTGTLT